MSKVNTYHHTYVRVDYPAENGYRMEVRTLPDWIHVTITEEDGSKFLTVHSRIHVNKEVIIHPVYSSDFTDRQILIDLTCEISHRFGC